jgi:hypothetical protein
MTEIDRIRKEYEKAVSKKKELSERLRQIEKTDPNKFSEIWTVRDQIAYWEGKSEGLKFALDELKR